MEMIKEAEFWVAVAFVIFLAILIYVGVHKTVADSLDKRRSRIQSELENSTQRLQTAQQLADDFTQVILPIGVALSEQKNFDILLRDILMQAKALCHADGGTLYTCGVDLSPTLR